MPFVTRSNKICLKLLEDNASEALLDLDALSGLAEISLEMEESIGLKSITKLGVSMGPPLGKVVVVPSQLVTMVPRYVVVNESEESISVRQCYLQVVLAFIILEVPFCLFLLFCPDSLSASVWRRMTRLALFSLTVNKEQHYSCGM